MHKHPNFKEKDVSSWRTMPNYSVMVVKGGSGRSDDVRYVPQVNIERILGSNALAAYDEVGAKASEYFSGFNDSCSRFILRGWLSERYPEDTTCVGDSPPTSSESSVTVEL